MLHRLLVEFTGMLTGCGGDKCSSNRVCGDGDYGVAARGDCDGACCGVDVGGVTAGACGGAEYVVECACSVGCVHALCGRCGCYVAVDGVGEVCWCGSWICQRGRAAVIIGDDYGGVVVE